MVSRRNESYVHAYMSDGAERERRRCPAQALRIQDMRSSFYITSRSLAYSPLPAAQWPPAAHLSTVGVSENMPTQFTRIIIRAALLPFFAPPLSVSTPWSRPLLSPMPIRVPFHSTPGTPASSRPLLSRPIHVPVPALQSASSRWAALAPKLSALFTATDLGPKRALFHQPR